MTTRLARPEATRQDAVDPTEPRPYKRAGFAFRVTATDLETAVYRWLDRHSTTLLRISMGAVIFGFGILKYFPGISPAENLILTITHLLTFGLVPGRVAMVLLATVECAIGLSLITTRGLRATIYLLVLWVLGILSPALLLPGRLFNGPDHAPTLEGQYVLKDIILLTASLVIAAATLRRTKANPVTPTPPSWAPNVLAAPTAADDTALAISGRQARAEPMRRHPARGAKVRFRWVSFTVELWWRCIGTCAIACGIGRGGAARRAGYRGGYRRRHQSLLNVP